MRAFNGEPQLDIDISRQDVAGAHSWMAAICGPHELKALRPANLRFRHIGRVLNTATIGYVEYGSEVDIHVDDEACFENFCISLPTAGCQELNIQGSRIISDQDTGCIIAPHQTQSLSMDSECKKIQLTLPATLVHDKLENLLGHRVSHRLEFDPSIDAGGLAGNWWRLIKYYLDESPLGLSDFARMHLATEIETIIVKTLLFSQPNNYSKELERVCEIEIPAHIKKAKTFIELNAKYELSLEDIESAAGISRYKLLTDFKKNLGTSPMAYLKKFRLIKIREALISDRSSKNVSTIAVSWGCTHLGRFSTEYRELFGECPSTTSRRHESKRRQST